MAQKPFDAPVFHQFHWQDYNDNRYMMALQHLRDLQSEGLIAAIGLCNFDAIRTDEICTQLGPGAIVSNQVQVCFTRMSVQFSFLFFLLTHKGLSFPSSIRVHCMACQTSAKSTTSNF
jgi:diketogulonate reductase-like aldo/keto reductase